LLSCGLDSYASAATASSDQDDFRKTLECLHAMSTSRNEAGPNLFTAIVTPTGTGKTQLAATAAHGRENVRYLLCDSNSSDATQPFYKPHTELASHLHSTLRAFILHFDAKLANTSGANGYFEWFSKEKVSSPLANLIHRILFPDSQQPTDTLSFGKLREKVVESESGFLVFLDEVPRRSSTLHGNIVILRDLLRAAGISPILMSTHSGAQNSVRVASGSSGTDEDPEWCRLITRLPQYHSSDPLNMTPYFCASERPLVALYMSQMPRNATVDDIVSTVKKKLQTKKRRAWLANPVFQLCQLFRSSVDVGSTHPTTHQLVGEHFGYLVKPNDHNNALHKLKRSESHALRFQVQMVAPQEEPMLFSALLSWSSSSLTSDGSDDALFPLVDDQGTAMSVRAAFDKNRHMFQPAVAISNPEAVKLHGDLLEVTSLAAVCLASMNSDDGVGRGVLLPMFLSCLFHFMQPNQTPHAPTLQETAHSIDKKLRAHSNTAQFADQRVPCCSSADSPYPNAWRKFTELFRGKLKRPRDSESRDGWIGKLKDSDTGEAQEETEGAPPFPDVMQIECKNYLSGLNKEVFSNVVKRIRPSCPITILFASSIKNIFTVSGSWNAFTEGLLSDPHDIAFLTLGAEGVSWLVFEKGTVLLAPTEKTQFLFVIVETGPVR